MPDVAFRNLKSTILAIDAVMPALKLVLLINRTGLADAIAFFNIAIGLARGAIKIFLIAGHAFIVTRTLVTDAAIGVVPRIVYRHKFQLFFRSGKAVVAAGEFIFLVHRAIHADTAPLFESAG